MASPPWSSFNTLPAMKFFNGCRLSKFGIGVGVFCTFLFLESQESKAFVLNSPPVPFAQVNNVQDIPGPNYPGANALWTEIAVPRSPRPINSKVLLSPGRGYKVVSGQPINSSGVQTLNFAYNYNFPNNAGVSNWSLSQITENSVAGLAINSFLVTDTAYDEYANQTYVTMAGNWKQLAPLRPFFEFASQNTTSYLPIGASGFVTTGFAANFSYADIPNRVDFVDFWTGFDGPGNNEDFAAFSTSFDNLSNAFSVTNNSFADQQSFYTKLFAISPVVDGYKGGDIAINFTFTSNVYLDPGTPIIDGGGGNDGNISTASVPGPLPILGLGAVFGYSRKLRKRFKSSKPEVISTTAV